MIIEMERLRFAWWNTRLVHKDGPKQQEIAREVVRRLIDGAGVVLLALGEVAEAHAEMLRDACHTRPLSLLAGDSVPGGMALCYRRDIVDLHRYERVTTEWRNKELLRILHAELIGLPLPLHLFVNHWPSNYLNDSAQAERREGRCSYNPFWRLLGERQSLQEALQPPRRGAGTFFYRGSNATSQWSTLDQLMVSAPLLNLENWHLLEEETFIWQEPPLLVEKTGRPRSEFDHFPIVGTLRSPGTIEQGRLSMADFQEAFRQGLAAYDDAERARKEIISLFDEFAEQIYQASTGRVLIERRKEKEATLDTPHPYVAPFGEPMVPFGRVRTREYDGLVASRPSGDQREELGEYELGERGYPVTLRYAKEDVRCHDREALERGLQKLLAHPETGGKLQRLMGTEQAA